MELSLCLKDLFTTESLGRKESDMNAHEAKVKYSGQ